MEKRMSEQRAKELMEAGRIESYVIEDGVAVVKRGMVEEPGMSWPSATEKE